MPRVYYRVGPKESYRTEAAALLEAAALNKDPQAKVSVGVYKCVAMRHDDVTMETAREDCPEWRIDDVVAPEGELLVRWQP